MARNKPLTTGDFFAMGVIAGLAVGVAVGGWCGWLSGVEAGERAGWCEGIGYNAATYSETTVRAYCGPGGVR